MSTLGTMRARIADELARIDLTSQISYAISDSIKAYESERWFFNETRDITFSTTATQEFYSESDEALLGTIVKLDYLALYIDNQPYQLLAMRPEEIEHASTNSTTYGSPSWYCLYNKKIRLYPIPDATYTVRVAAVVQSAEPADDAEAANPWMTSAERLIRSRAKLELALHVLKDSELATVMSQAVTEAYEQLKDRTNYLTQVGEGRIVAMPF
jgi:hypothetical protein